MSTQVQHIGSIQYVDRIKKFLFVDEEPSAWLDTVQFSLSASGDLCTFLHKNHIIVSKIKDYREVSNIEYELVYEGILADINVETATFVLALSVALQQKNVGTTTSIKTSTWDCIAVGFSSGFMRIYTEKGVLLFEQIFNPHPIKSIKYCHPMILQDELIIVYDDMIIAVDGFSLYQCLRFCRMQQQKTTSNVSKNVTISFKKWLLQDQISTADVEFFGVRNTTPFEHLFQASLAGGSANYIGQAGLGPVYNYIAVGKNPFIAQYCPTEQGACPIMSEVVMNVATKLISYIPGSSWLSSWTQASKDEQLNFVPPIPISKNVCIDDPRREIMSIKASPKGNMGILLDKFGRLLLLDVTSMIIVDIWKGYRDAQCGWIDISCTTDISVAEKQQSTLFLIVYIRKRGILEIWCPYQHYRVAAFNVGKGGKLISSKFGALGEGSLASPLNISHWRASKSCCFLLKEDGMFFNISVPFKNCLGMEFLLSLEDSKLVKNVVDILESHEVSYKKQEEIKKHVIEMKSASNIRRIMDIIQNDRKLPDEFKLNICHSIMSKISKSSSMQNQNEFIEVYQSCKMFTNLSNLYQQASDHWKLIGFLNSSSKSCLLSDSQTIIERYFLKAKLNFSFEFPNKTDFHNSFTIESSSSLNDNPVLNLNPSKEFVSTIQICRFLTLLLLHSEDWIHIINQLSQSGIPVTVTFNMFLESCMTLDIQITSQEYQAQIRQIINHILSMYDSPSKLWNDLFCLVKCHSNVCHGLIILIYCQNIAIDALELDSCTIESTSSGKNLIYKSDDHFEDEVGWISLSPEHEQWYTVRQQLTDVLHLQINTGIECTIDTLLNSNDRSVTHIVANHIIDNNLIQNVVDWIERCHVVTVGEREELNKEEFDDNLHWLLNLIPWWPYQLNPTTISVCLIECLIFRWSEVLESESPEVDITCLMSAAKVLLSVQSVLVQQNLLQVLWETVFSFKLKRIYGIIEKIGRQPKDRMCLKEISLSLKSTIDFVSIARHILVNTNIASEPKEEKSVLKNENVWASDQRSWLIHKVVSTEKKINPDFVMLHAQLLTTMELVISLNVKNIRPSALFLAKFNNLFFTPLTSSGNITFSSSPDIDYHREQMLKMSIKPSISSEIEIHPYSTSWISLIINLAILWGLAMPIQSYLAVLLYSVGKFDEANEIVMTSSYRQDLGLQLLGVLLSQLELHIFKDEHSQKLYLPILTPQLSSWLKTKHDPDVAFLNVRTVFKAFSIVLTWVNGDDIDISNSKKLQSCLLNIF